MTFRQKLLRSLRHRNFRLYFTGQCVSLSGTWMQHVAQSWLVYRLTGSAFMLGLVAFLGLLPILLFGLFAGHLSDRLPRRGLLATVQVIAAVQAVALAALTLAGAVEVWHVILLAMVLGICQAFEMPARHAFIAEIVPREDLPNAIALNSSLFNLARFVGPALAGALVALAGEGWVFALNAVTYLAFLAALLYMTPMAPRAPADGHGGMLEGLRVAWAHPAIRGVLWLVTLVSIVAAPYTVLMPVFAREVFGGGPELLGILLGTGGAGAFVGALVLAHRAAVGGQERAVPRAAIAGGVALGTFGISPHLALALPALLVAGFALTTLVASSNTFIQLAVEDRVRGRVMAVFSVLFIGMTPIGNLVAGAVAEAVGVQATLTAYGAICAAGGLLHLRLMRPAT